MKVFTLKVLIDEISKAVPCSVSLMLNLTWDIDILSENLTQETGMDLKNRLCTRLLGWRFHAKPVTWGQVNRLGVEETMHVVMS